MRCSIDRNVADVGGVDPTAQFEVMISLDQLHQTCMCLADVRISKALQVRV